MRDLWLILHFLGLGIGMGASVAMLVIAFRTRALPPAERGPIMREVGILRHVGPVGLLILVASGIALTAPMSPAIMKTGLFHLKLTLVVLLLAWVGYQHGRVARARRRGQTPTPPALWLMALPLVVVSSVIVVAVLIFH